MTRFVLAGLVGLASAGKQKRVADVGPILANLGTDEDLINSELDSKLDESTYETTDSERPIFGADSSMSDSFISTDLSEDLGGNEFNPSTVHADAVLDEMDRDDRKAALQKNGAFTSDSNTVWNSLPASDSDPISGSTIDSIGASSSLASDSFASSGFASSSLASSLSEIDSNNGASSLDASSASGSGFSSSTGIDGDDEWRRLEAKNGAKLAEYKAKLADEAWEKERELRRWQRKRREKIEDDYQLWDKERRRMRAYKQNMAGNWDDTGILDELSGLGKKLSAQVAQNSAANSSLSQNGKKAKGESDGDSKTDEADANADLIELDTVSKGPEKLEESPKESSKKTDGKTKATTSFVSKKGGKTENSKKSDSKQSSDAASAHHSVVDELNEQFKDYTGEDLYGYVKAGKTSKQQIPKNFGIEAEFAAIGNELNSLDGIVSDEKSERTEKKTEGSGDGDFIRDEPKANFTSPSSFDEQEAKAMQEVPQEDIDSLLKRAKHTIGSSYLELNAEVDSHGEIGNTSKDAPILRSAQNAQQDGAHTTRSKEEIAQMERQQTEVIQAADNQVTQKLNAQLAATHLEDPEKEARVKEIQQQELREQPQHTEEGDYVSNVERQDPPRYKAVYDNVKTQQKQHPVQSSSTENLDVSYTESYLPREIEASYTEGSLRESATMSSTRENHDIVSEQEAMLWYGMDESTQWTEHIHSSDTTVNLYVAPNGHDTIPTGQDIPGLGQSKRTPFKTLEHALSMVDTMTFPITTGSGASAVTTNEVRNPETTTLKINIAAGTYQVPEGLNATGLQNVWIQGAPKSSGSLGTKFVFNRNTGLHLMEPRNVTISDLEMEGPSQHITWNEALTHRHHYANFLVEGVTAKMLTESDIRPNSRFTARGIDIQGTEANICKNVRIANVNVHDCPGTGVKFSHCDYILLENSEISRNSFWTPSGGSGVVISNGFNEKRTSSLVGGGKRSGEDGGDSGDQQGTAAGENTGGQPTESGTAALQEEQRSNQGIGQKTNNASSDGGLVQKNTSSDTSLIQLNEDFTITSFRYREFDPHVRSDHVRSDTGNLMDSNLNSQMIIPEEETHRVIIRNNKIDNNVNKVPFLDDESLKKDIIALGNLPKSETSSGQRPPASRVQWKESGIMNFTKTADPDDKIEGQFPDCDWWGKVGYDFQEHVHYGITDPLCTVSYDDHIRRCPPNARYGKPSQDYILDGQGLVITRMENYRKGRIQISGNQFFKNGLNGIAIQDTRKGRVFDNQLWDNGVIPRIPVSAASAPVASASAASASAASVSAASASAASLVQLSGSFLATGSRAETEQSEDSSEAESSEQKSSTETESDDDTPDWLRPLGHATRGRESDSGIVLKNVQFMELWGNVVKAKYDDDFAFSMELSKYGERQILAEPGFLFSEDNSMSSSLLEAKGNYYSISSSSLVEADKDFKDKITHNKKASNTHPPPAIMVRNRDGNIRCEGRSNMQATLDQDIYDRDGIRKVRPAEMIEETAGHASPTVPRYGPITDFSPPWMLELADSKCEQQTTFIADHRAQVCRNARGSAGIFVKNSKSYFFKRWFEYKFCADTCMKQSRALGMVNFAYTSATFPTDASKPVTSDASDECRKLKPAPVITRDEQARIIQTRIHAARQNAKIPGGGLALSYASKSPILASEPTSDLEQHLYAAVGDVQTIIRDSVSSTKDSFQQKIEKSVVEPVQIAISTTENVANTVGNSVQKAIEKTENAVNSVENTVKSKMGEIATAVQTAVHSEAEDSNAEIEDSGKTQRGYDTNQKQTDAFTESKMVTLPKSNPISLETSASVAENFESTAEYPSKSEHGLLRRERFNGVEERT